ncbi:MAG: alpha/beta fold hydrolase [Pseudomonadota bacterium]
MKFAMDDGDVLVAALHRPEEASHRPLVILIHGLAGCEDSPYMRVTSLGLLAHGYPVLRLNLRGSGPSRPLCHGQYHAGRSEDFAAVLAALPDDLAGNGVIAIGYSLGGNMLLKHLGEQGASCGLLGAVTVSGPIDLKATLLAMLKPRNRLYHHHMLGLMKREVVAPASDLSAAERDTVRRARTVYEFDDWVVAPRHGFGRADRYYEQCSAKNHLSGICVPTLIIHGRNDPWVPAAMFDEVPWQSVPLIRLLMASGGGHLGFHGLGNHAPWHDRCIIRFLSDL